MKRASSSDAVDLFSELFMDRGSFRSKKVKRSRNLPLTVVLCSSPLSAPESQDDESATNVNEQIEKSTLICKKNTSTSDDDEILELASFDGCVGNDYNTVGNKNVFPAEQVKVTSTDVFAFDPLPISRELSSSENITTKEEIFRISDTPSLNVISNPYSECNIFVKMYPKQDNISDGYRIFGPCTPDMALESVLFNTNSIYLFEGIPVVGCTRLLSLLPLLLSSNFSTNTDDVTIEIFDVASIPTSFEEYAAALRLLTLPSPIATVSPTPHSVLKWEYLKFVKESNEPSIIISKIDPQKDTLNSIFHRESISLPLSFDFDGDSLNPNIPVENLGLEDGDSIELFY